MAGERQRVYVLFAGLISVLVGLDQLTKWLISRHPVLVAGDQITVFSDFLGVHFHLVLLHNEGAAWGIFSGRQYLLAAVSSLVFLAMFYWYRAFTGGWREREWAIGMLLGGIVGNLIDRIFQPGVIDFLRFFYQSRTRFFEWPSFNVADIAICVGVGLYMVSSFARPDGTPPTGKDVVATAEGGAPSNDIATGANDKAQGS